MVALLITGMLIVMILQKRKEVADTLSARFPAGSHPAKLMRKWHHFAIFFGYSRMKEIIVSSLRMALAALFIIWTLNIWGIELSIGEAVAKAVFNILIVVLICYVLWEFLNTVIQRRLSAEMPDGDEDLEEGGAGGSRLGTLLLLLRKFLNMKKSVRCCSARLNPRASERWMIRP